MIASTVSATCGCNADARDSKAGIVCDRCGAPFAVTVRKVTAPRSRLCCGVPAVRRVSFAGRALQCGACGGGVA